MSDQTKLPKGWKVTTKRDPSSGMYEARLWFEGQYRTTMPCLFDYKDEAVRNCIVWFWHCNKTA